MSNIVLSAAVRQNLLSLQTTSSLLATTQEQLATGKSVNSALDNPTNYFTAAGLDSRASDINSLLDGVSNGVQILQAANTGITSLNKLIATAKSIASQALQTPVGYSTKSNVAANIPGANANDLRGTTGYSNATAVGNILYSGAAGGTTAATASSLIGGAVGSTSFNVLQNNDTTPTAINASTVIAAASGAASNALGATIPASLVGSTLTVNGHTITFSSSSTPAAAAVPAGSGVTGNVVTDGSGNSTVYLGGAAGGTSSTTIGDVLNAIDLASGVKTAVNTSGSAALTTVGTASSVNSSGQLTITSLAGNSTAVTGTNDVLKFFGLTNSTGSSTTTLTVGSSTGTGTIANLIKDGSTLNVDGKLITFKAAPVPSASAVPNGSGVSGNVVTDGNGNSTVYLQGGTIQDALNAIDLATGTKTATITSGSAALATASGATPSTVAANGQLQISTGSASDLTISTGTGNALSSLGLAGNQGTATSFNAQRASGPGGISGKTMTFTAFNGGTPVNVTFGDGTNGTVKTLAQLNAALAANNLTASVDTNGNLSIAASNDYASSTLGSVKSGGVIGGTITTALSFTNPTAPVADTNSQATRASLVSQYNNIIAQITTTAQDASFNGVNLLNGDTLKLVFNETGTSTLNIVGQQVTPSSLGLGALTSGTDLLDNSSANTVLASLNAAGTQLNSLASSLGSNLSIVQIRQDFSKNLINVLQTGSSNLTLADPNEEAANSQALTTRQSIAVSALALANQSQQSVLQLLR